MGTLVDRLGKSVYLDTNIIIYVIEGFQQYEGAIRALLSAMDTQTLHAVTSELTIAEVLVKPRQDKNAGLEQAYLRFLQSSLCMSILPVNRAVLIQAADIRANSRLALPDAIHAATSLQAGCDSFLTNDRLFLGIPNPRTYLLDSIAAD